MQKLGRVSQFGLLLWKEAILLKQKKLVTVFQILLPIAFAMLLIIIRRLVDNTNRSDTTWNAYQPDTILTSLSNNVVLYAPDTGKVTTVMSAVGTKLGANFTGEYCRKS